jgi:hypothetical protein
MFLSDFHKFEFSRQISINISNVKFHENLPSGSRAEICRWKDMTKKTAASGVYANAPEKLEERHGND